MAMDPGFQACSSWIHGKKTKVPRRFRKRFTWTPALGKPFEKNSMCWSFAACYMWMWICYLICYLKMWKIGCGFNHLQSRVARLLPGFCEIFLWKFRRQFHPGISRCHHDPLDISPARRLRSALRRLSHCAGRQSLRCGRSKADPFAQTNRMARRF